MITSAYLEKIRALEIADTVNLLNITGKKNSPF
jgi:hypothetical protein